MRLAIAAPAALAALIALPALAAEDNPLTQSESWEALQYDVLGEATPADGAGLFTVDAPYRANDAATVPVHIVQTDTAPVIEKAIVVVDENPAPVAATFTFGAQMHPLDLELRVRVNQYSNVRVIIETAQGLAMQGRFVKASGGCSAPATSDPEAALASMGQMRLRSFGPAPQMSTPRREAQIMIRHPNYSGLQRDQITQLFVPAHFIDTLEVRQGDDLLFTMEGGISISENPVFRFSYSDNGAADIVVRATDTEGNVFEERLPKDEAS
ncbi:quinoprotein dehydrogenase-associated SoxYZ-like carrier [Oceanicola sp. 502str15]|uniref:quinoprotein dehydrogenase-associated SoxYZ-like carrier n=1 Tax=Oceanicola sp. 502str15 TaxID=2696061 RepID=UPI002094750B|nr:quinoprotein dehydrogenase-associated SoxYZ-like carrier [Oceanicola sp. 502str15]MCO6382092.1 quinoprotein dehydrogenase-associated SoxYZ-like carrier [Oceanicola sp. 502str15]